MPILIYAVYLEVSELPGARGMEFTREEIYRAVTARSADVGLLPDESEVPGAEEVLLRSITVNILGATVEQDSPAARCEQSPTGKHEPDLRHLLLADDDERTIYDCHCLHCGRDGSFFLEAKDVEPQWEDS